MNAVTIEYHRKKAYCYSYKLHKNKIFNISDDKWWIHKVSMDFSQYNFAKEYFKKRDWAKTKHHLALILNIWKEDKKSNALRENVMA